MSVELKGIRKTFGRTVALDGVDLQIGTGIFGLLGPNGAGKTTLMRIITTLIAPDGGQGKILGLDIHKQSRDIRRLLGYMPQEFGMYNNLSAEQMLEYIAVLKGIKNTRRPILDVLERVGLGDRSKDKVGGYSGGMKRRLGIAQAILGDPELLVVDEPTAGLDPEERVRFRNLLVDLAAKRTVILSTHIVGDIEASCSELAVMAKGAVLFKGKVSALAAAAKDKVWELPQPLPPGCKLISTRREEEEVLCRVLAAENPGQATSCPPSLEDGYMLLMEEQGRATDAKAG